MKELSINHLKDNMYRNPETAYQVMTTKQVRETVLCTENYVIACGRGWSLKTTNIVGDLKEVRLVPFVNKGLKKK